MTIDDNIFTTLLKEGLYDKYPDIYISDNPTEEQIELIKKRLSKIGKLSLETPNSVYVFGRSMMDIPFGTKFNVLFSGNNPSNNFTVRAILKYANAHPNYESSVIPKGHTGVICLIEFDTIIPEAINVLSKYGQQWHKNITYHLSQQPILDRILELINT
jgi:hypothetical protein